MLSLQVQLEELLRELPENFSFDIAELFQRVHPRTVDDLVLSISRAKSEKDGVALVWFLARLEGVPSDLLQQALIDFTTHRLQAVRAEAIRGLALFENSKSLFALKVVIGQETNLDVRLAGVYALGNLKVEAVLPILVGVLERKTEDVQVRGMAAEGIGKVGIPATFVIEALRRVVISSPPEVVFWAVGAVASLNLVSELGTLRQALAQAQHPTLRTEIRDAIEMLE